MTTRRDPATSARSALPACRPGADALAAGRAAFDREPGLCVIGIAGIFIAVVCMVGVAINGRVMEPEGKLFDAATFTFGVGVYTLTIAVLLPLAGFTPAGRRRWRRAFYVFTVYGLVLESLQAFRGRDPRFTEIGDPIDQIAGFVFGLTAGLNTILFVLFGIQFFRHGVLADRPVLRLGIRYGIVAVAISFGVGVVMSVNAGREIGDDGNLLVSHGLGVHGLQTMPLVALLVSASTVRRQRAVVHVAGMAWLTACLAALLQAALGRAPWDASALTVVVAMGATAWVASAAYALVMWGQKVSWRTA